MVSEKLNKNISNLEKRFEDIPKERKEILNTFTEYISNKVKLGNDVLLTFICTHNSRRSHMSQIWAQTAAEYYNVPNVYCYSGGTEATAFNPRAVKAARNFGFEIIQDDESDNPVYLVHFSDKKKPLHCFSKVYDDSFNPNNNYAAIMTCSHADENCPVVFGAEKRFPIRYNDPKEFDDTDLEENKYSERFRQIGTEMLFVFSQINNNFL